MAWTEYEGKPVNWLERIEGSRVNFSLPGESYWTLTLHERMKRQQEYLRLVWRESGMKPPGISS